jgi:hypothetical protein
MRDAEEYRKSRRYIEQNPVEAKLVERPEDYALSSASGKYVLDLSRFEEVRGYSPSFGRCNVAAEAATHKPGVS